MVKHKELLENRKSNLTFFQGAVKKMVSWVQLVRKSAYLAQWKVSFRKLEAQKVKRPLCSVADLKASKNSSLSATFACRVFTHAVTLEVRLSTTAKNYKVLEFPSFWLFGAPFSFDALPLSPLCWAFFVFCDLLFQPFLELEPSHIFGLQLLIFGHIPSGRV